MYTRIGRYRYHVKRYSNLRAENGVAPICRERHIIRQISYNLRIFVLSLYCSVYMLIYTYIIDGITDSAI